MKNKREKEYKNIRTIITKKKMEKIINEFGKKLIFLPDATRGAVRYVTTEQLKATGTTGVVINTLHLLVGMGPERIQRLGGMHKFMNWDGWILSDSGGFQVFSLIHSGKWTGKINNDGAHFREPRTGNKFTLTPESSIDIQIALDSDVLVALDDCRDAEISRYDAEKSIETTLKWAERCHTHFNKVHGGTKKTGKILSAVVQGANFPDLREYCAKELVKMGFDGYNFGGYPVDKNGKLVEEVLKVVIDNIPDDKFRYAMGIGKPEDIIKCAEIGYTVFDTVLVTRNARHGTVYIFDSNGNPQAIHIKNAQYAEDTSPIEEACTCEACRNHSKAYFHNLIKVDEGAALSLLSIHNLTFYQRLIAGLRIKE